MNAALIPAGLLALITAIAGLGFSETVLAQTGVNRLRKLLAGENQNEEFTPEEQVRLMTSILIARLFLILILGGLVMLWTFQLHETVWVEIGALCGTGLLLALFDTLARRHARFRAQAAAGRVLGLVRSLNTLISPLVSSIFGLTSPLSPVRAVDPIASLEDLQDEILELRSQGLLKETQTEMFQSLLDFGETIAREVMVPRVDMVCIKIGTPLEEVLELMNENGHSRIPVYQDSIDEILGFVHVKDLIVDMEQIDRPLDEEDLRRVLVVPGTKKVGEILRDFQAQKRALAVVLDEYGGTDGLLTVEDIVEEIVGEINDEYDDEIAEVESFADGTFRLDAKMILEDVNQVLSSNIPTEGAETLGGYLYELFGHAPTEGEKVQVSGLRFAIEGVQRNRITWVRVERVPDSEYDGDGDDDEREQVA